MSININREYYLLLILLLLLYNCTKEDISKNNTEPKYFEGATKKTPVVKTDSVSYNKVDTIKVYCSLKSNGGDTTTQIGICWGFSKLPTISNNPTWANQKVKNFSIILTNLKPKTTYYFRASAKTFPGVTAYGEEFIIVTEPLKYNLVLDNSGNAYKTIVIGKTEWMSENLRTTKYNDGSEIFSTDTLNKNISNDISAKYYWHYNNKPNSNNGCLYTWNVITDTRGVCPQGFRIPTQTDYNNLLVFAGDSIIAGSYLKTDSAGIWKNTSLAIDNNIGYLAFPAGFRYNDGKFNGLTSFTYFWTINEYSTNSNYAVCKYLSDKNNKLETQMYKKNVGMSVRCVKDR